MKVYLPDGTVTEVWGTEPVYNALTTLPVLTDLPAAYNLVIALDGPEGRYLNLLPASILRDLRLAQAAATQELQTIQTGMSAVLGQLAARKEIIILPTVTVSVSELITVLTAAKSFSKACAGLLPTDTLLVTASSLPAGYGIRAYACTAADTIRLDLQLPPLASGGTAITFNVTVFR